jgi:hypothetical protein
MCRIILIALLLILLSGCQGLPTLEVTATAVPTTLPTALVPTATAMIVQITGDVYVRDNQGKVVGWLYNGSQVQAQCLGNWCSISSGSYTGYHFWRGCSSDNPEDKKCQSK